MITSDDVRALRIAFDEMERRWEFDPQDTEFIASMHDLGDAVESIESQFQKGATHG